MADRQISVLAVADGNSPYVLAGSQQFLLKAVNATFDGTGASGAYLPGVEVVSDAGIRVSLNVTDASLPAGNSATVTFAPF